MYDCLLRGDKTNDIRLQPEDVIFIPRRCGRHIRLCTVAGHLRTKTRPPSGPHYGRRLNDIAFKGRLQINRIVDNNRDIIIESTLDEPATEKMRIQPGDLLAVFSVVSETGFVRLSGAVHRGGEYGIGAGMTVKDLIEMAGGLKYFAYTEDAELTRVSVTQDGPVTEKINRPQTSPRSGLMTI
jgi:hypothetical protein